MSGIIEWVCKDMDQFGADYRCEGPNKGQYEGEACDCYSGGWKEHCQNNCGMHHNHEGGLDDDCDCPLVCDQPVHYEPDNEDWDSRFNPFEGYNGSGDSWRIGDRRGSVHGSLCCSCSKAILEHMEQYRAPGDTDADLMRLAFRFEWTRRQTAERNEKLGKTRAVLDRMRREAGIPDREPEPEGDCTRCARGRMEFAGVAQYQQPHGEWFRTEIFECPACGLAVDRSSSAHTQRNTEMEPQVEVLR